MSPEIGEATGQFSGLLLIFTGVALLLAAVGLYGVIAGTKSLAGPTRSACACRSAPMRRTSGAWSCAGKCYKAAYRSPSASERSGRHHTRAAERAVRCGRARSGDVRRDLQCSWLSRREAKTYLPARLNHPHIEHAGGMTVRANTKPSALSRHRNLLLRPSLRTDGWRAERSPRSLARGARATLSSRASARTSMHGTQAPSQGTPSSRGART